MNIVLRELLEEEVDKFLAENYVQPTRSDRLIIMAAMVTGVAIGVAATKEAAGLQ